MMNNKVEDTSLTLLTARLDELTTEIGRLDEKKELEFNAALYLVLFTTRN